MMAVTYSILTSLRCAIVSMFVLMSLSYDSVDVTVLLTYPILTSHVALYGASGIANDLYTCSHFLLKVAISVLARAMMLMKWSSNFSQVY